ncbi:MAG: RloB family protein [Bacteroidales bacterium]|nr:RloB family protein [Bacteroidales bacterium]
MRTPTRRVYVKKEPFRDAILFLIICEGEKREPQYFEFFDGLSTRIKVYPVPNVSEASAPNHLLQNAEIATNTFDLKETDELWFVLDIDSWHGHINNLQSICKKKRNWNIALSNPCFEVWLFFHILDNIDLIQDKNQCTNWRQVIPTILNGGFNSKKHPALIGTAISNASSKYSETGYLPNVGSTQVFKLGQKIYPFIEEALKSI